jgi:transcriptional regulator with XRE-family HTH domain
MGPRRAIGAVLRQLRETSNKSLAEVAADTLISRSKLSRLETAQGTPQLRDIRDLIQYYGIKGTAQADRLQRWLTAAREPGWWTDFDDDLSAGPVNVHLAAEADATVERAYTLPFVPALLQTDDYAASLFRDMEGRTEDETRQLVRMRRRRKGVLRVRDGLPPLKLIAVMHETALHQVVGSTETMRAQLDFLVNLPTGLDVQLHVLPFVARPAFSMTCMYAYLEYQDAQVPDVVSIETHNGFVSVEVPGQVAIYRRAHDALVAASLGGAESREFIDSVRSDLYGG